MNNGSAVANAPDHRRPRWLVWLAGAAILLVVLVLLAVFFPWDVLRGPLNRYVSDRTGRHFEITRRLDVKLGFTTRVLADGVEFANPAWAADPMLITASAAEVDIRLLPLLLRGRIDLPLVNLHSPQLGLQMEVDGRRSWALGRDSANPSNIPEIGALTIDQGSVHFISTGHGADIQTEFALSGAADGNSLPLSFKAHGRWQRQPFTAQGRTGNVLHLSGSHATPFPLRIEAAAAHTTLKAAGTVDRLAGLDGANADFTLQGSNLAELYQLLGVVLPETPRYELRAHLDKHAEVWNVSGIRGKLGNSDLVGQLSFDHSQSVPLLTGKIHSEALDFVDLAPLVGLPEQPRSAAALPSMGAAPAGPAVKARLNLDPGKVLPTATLDLARLKAMNAEVQYSAARITNVRQLPLDRMNVQVNLKDGVLRLDPMKLGLAGGELTGRLKIDGNHDPARVEVKVDASSMELNKLFPGLKITKASLGRIQGIIDLQGQGNSVARMLATSSGNVALVMGKGKVSSLLLEFAELDGVGIIKNLVTGNRDSEVRCAAAAFDVHNGLMKSRTIVLDASDATFAGSGDVSLANETLNLTVLPQPKDSTFLSLRSPLKVAGTFAHPKAGVDKATATGKAGVALVLGAINPLLGLFATVDSGHSKDVDCSAVLAQAKAPAATARAAAAGPPEPSRSGPAAASDSPTSPTAMPAAAPSPQDLARARLERLERLPQERDAAARSAGK
jgi:uncharacterized protein involved in outer membrane biogenesis